MKTDTPTPETDAVAYHARHVFGPLERIVPIDHARKLERQRDDALKSISEIRAIVTEDESFGAVTEAVFAQPLREQEEKNRELKRQRDALNEALKEVMEWIVGWSPPFIYEDAWDATEQKAIATVKGEA